MTEEQMTKTEVVQYEPPRVSALQIKTWAELAQFADLVAASSMVPAGFIDRQTRLPNKASIMLAVAFGAELGLSPLQALQNVMVTKGRPCVWGDALPGLAWQSGKCERFDEWFEGSGETLTAVCETKRRGNLKPTRRTFSVADAKVAKLWGKRGANGEETPWTTSPKRMLQMRARAYALRDAYPDVLKGLYSDTEVMDIPDDGILEPAGGHQGMGMDTSRAQDAQVVDEALRRAESYIEAIDRCTDMDHFLKLQGRSVPLKTALGEQDRGKLLLKVIRAEKDVQARIASAKIDGQKEPEEAPAQEVTEEQAGEEVRGDLDEEFQQKMEA